MNITAIRALIRNDLRLYRSDRRAVIVGILMPILIAAFFGYLFGQNSSDEEAGKVPIAVVDEDGSAITRAIITQIAGDSMLQVTPLAREAARENVAYAEVAAPFSGAVAARHVQPGDVIVPGQPLFDVVSPGHLRVVIDVPQSLAGLLRDQARASVLLGSGRIESDAVKVFGAADPAAGTVRVWVDLPADVAGVFAGQFVRVAIPDGGAADLSIPAGTLVERSEVTAVYVVEKDGTVRLRQIRVGERGGERVQVLAGLSAGERIVTDPLAFMRQRGQAAGP